MGYHRRVALLSSLLAAALIAGLPAGLAWAHFQEILPSADVLPEGGAVSLDLIFTHPMERGPVMEMARPKRIGVKFDGADVDLTSRLAKTAIAGKTAWRLTYKLDRPGAAIFYVEPQPYWEPAEGKYIIHYAKVTVDAFASGEAWDVAVGLPVEIKPLVRPTGLWAGNLFRGVVLKDGKPVPGAQIEVEYVNDGSLAIPNEAFITQVIKADENGLFSYAMPRAGWWGFAALVKGDTPMKSPKGADVPVELGALIWVKATAMAPAAPSQ